MKGVELSGNAACPYCGSANATRGSSGASCLDCGAVYIGPVPDSCRDVTAAKLSQLSIRRQRRLDPLNRPAALEYYAAYKQDFKRSGSVRGGARYHEKTRIFWDRGVQRVTMQVELERFSEVEPPRVWLRFDIRYMDGSYGRCRFPNYKQLDDENATYFPDLWNAKKLYRMACESADRHHDIKSIENEDVWTETYCKECYARLDPWDKPSKNVWHCTRCGWTGTYGDRYYDQATYDPRDFDLDISLITLNLYSELEMPMPYDIALKQPQPGSPPTGPRLQASEEAMA